MSRVKVEAWDDLGRKVRRSTPRERVNNASMRVRTINAPAPAARRRELVLKVVHWSKSTNGARRLAHYIARDDMAITRHQDEPLHALENEAGQRLDTSQAIDAEVRSWDLAPVRENRSRAWLAATPEERAAMAEKAALARPQSVHFIISLPKGTEHQAEELRQVTREFLAERFEGRRYVWTIHNDNGNAHAHVSMKARSEPDPVTGRTRALRITKEDLDVWRGDLAQRCRERGIDVTATRRIDRPELRPEILEGTVRLRHSETMAGLHRGDPIAQQAPGWYASHGLAYERRRAGLPDEPQPASAAVAPIGAETGRARNLLDRIKGMFGRASDPEPPTPAAPAAPPAHDPAPAAPPAAPPVDPAADARVRRYLEAAGSARSAAAQLESERKRNPDRAVSRLWGYEPYADAVRARDQIARRIVAEPETHAAAVIERGVDQQSLFRHAGLTGTATPRPDRPDLREVRATLRDATAATFPAPAALTTAERADAVLAELTRQSVVFTAADMKRAVKALPLDPAGRAEVLTHLQGHPDVINLGRQENKRTDYYTTRPVVEAEARLIDRAAALAADRAGALSSDALQQGLARYAADFQARTGHAVSDQQRDAIHHALTGARLSVIEGTAGAGKSTMIAGAAEIWKAQGDAYRVRGVALAGIAAANLDDAGIQSETIAGFLARQERQDAIAHALATGSITDEVRAAMLSSLDFRAAKAEADGDVGTIKEVAEIRADVTTARRLAELPDDAREWATRWGERQVADRLDARTLLVVDEAGMVGTEQMDKLLARAQEAGARVVAMGDHQQLQPIDAGASFRLLSQRVGSAQLTEVVRQRDPGDRAATQALATGAPADARRALQHYIDRGAVTLNLAAGIDPARLRQETERGLGRQLTDREFETVQRLGNYMEARLTGGSLWAEITAQARTKAEIEAHPLYADFQAAQQRRAAGALSITADIEGHAPWLARFGVSGQGVAADSLHARGVKRSAAEERAPQEAARLGIAELPAPDVKLSFDFRGEARKALLSEWRADLDANASETRIVLTYTRDDVARLNADARQIMRDSGRLTGPDVSVTIERPAGATTERETLPFAVGDRVLTLKADRGLGVLNGSTGTVAQIDTTAAGPVLSVRLDNGRTVQLDPTKYANFQHGYASTTHKAQGVTVDRTWILGHGSFDRHMGYVALSRHRIAVRVFGTRLDAPTATAFLRSWSAADSKKAVSDYAIPREILSRVAPAAGAAVKPPIGAPAVAADAPDRWAAAVEAAHQRQRLTAAQLRQHHAEARLDAFVRATYADPAEAIRSFRALYAESPKLAVWSLNNRPEIHGRVIGAAPEPFTGRGLARPAPPPAPIAPPPAAAAMRRQADAAVSARLRARTQRAARDAVERTANYLEGTLLYDGRARAAVDRLRAAVQRPTNPPLPQPELSGARPAQPLHKPMDPPTVERQPPKHEDRRSSPAVPTASATGTKPTAPQPAPQKPQPPKPASPKPVKPGAPKPGRVRLPFRRGPKV